MGSRTKQEFCHCLSYWKRTGTKFSLLSHKYPPGPGLGSALSSLSYWGAGRISGGLSGEIRVTLLGKKNAEPSLLRMPTTRAGSVVFRIDTSPPLPMGEKKVPCLKSQAGTVSHRPTKTRKNNDRIIPSSSSTIESGASRRPWEILFYSTLWGGRSGKAMKNTSLKVSKINEKDLLCQFKLWAAG